MDITGIIRQIYDTQQVSEKFKKRDFVITDNSSQYPQHIQFQLCQDKCALIDGCNIGDEIKVHYNLRGKEWNNPKGETKYFNTLDCWRIEKLSYSGSSNTQNTNDGSRGVATEYEDSDLPF